MLSILHWQILKSIAVSDTISFEALVDLERFDQKLVYQVLQALNQKKILIKTDIPGFYQIDYDKLSCLMIETSSHFMSMDHQSIKRISMTMTTESQLIIKEFMVNRKIRISESTIDTQVPDVDFLIQNDILTLCGPYIFTIAKQEQLQLIMDVKAQKVEEEPEVPKFENLMKRYRKTES